VPVTAFVWSSLSFVTLGSSISLHFQSNFRNIASRLWLILN